MDYVPAPIDTANVDLSEDLLELSRLLAKNNHEVWSRQRIDDGWQYGPVRDDSRKEHPSLVPYEELSESERKYDVIMAEELLKAVMVLGFHIEKS
jgi:RyR domain